MTSWWPVQEDLTFPLFHIASNHKGKEPFSPLCSTKHIDFGQIYVCYCNSFPTSLFSFQISSDLPSRFHLFLLEKKLELMVSHPFSIPFPLSGLVTLMSSPLISEDFNWIPLFSDCCTGSLVVLLLRQDLLSEVAL
jgi:hypothetical protein